MNISQTKLLKTLSVHEPTPQMQTYFERKEKLWDGTFNIESDITDEGSGFFGGTGSVG